MSREWNTVLSSPLHKNHEVHQLIHSIFKYKCTTIQQASTHSSVTAHRCNFPTAAHWLAFSPEVNITCSLSTWDQTGLRVFPSTGYLAKQNSVNIVQTLWSELINMYIYAVCLGVDVQYKMFINQLLVYVHRLILRSSFAPWAPYF